MLGRQENNVVSNFSIFIFDNWTCNNNFKYCENSLKSFPDSDRKRNSDQVWQIVQISAEDHGQSSDQSFSVKILCFVV